MILISLLWTRRCSRWGCENRRVHVELFMISKTLLMSRDDLGDYSTRPYNQVNGSDEKNERELEENLIDAIQLYKTYISVLLSYFYNNVK